jgi:hypothetical protein
MYPKRQVFRYMKLIGDPYLLHKNDMESKEKKSINFKNNSSKRNQKII